MFSIFSLFSIIENGFKKHESNMPQVFFFVLKITKNTSNTKFRPHEQFLENTSMFGSCFLIPLLETAFKNTEKNYSYSLNLTFNPRVECAGVYVKGHGI